MFFCDFSSILNKRLSLRASAHTGVAIRSFLLFCNDQQIIRCALQQQAHCPHSPKCTDKNQTI